MLGREARLSSRNCEAKSTRKRNRRYRYEHTEFVRECASPKWPIALNMRAKSNKRGRGFKPEGRFTEKNSMTAESTSLYEQ
jgi:hypothetical protein